jgi:hypothetical protein
VQPNSLKRAVNRFSTKARPISGEGIVPSRTASRKRSLNVRTGRSGTTGFDLEHEIRADGTLAAEGRFVLVAYDYMTGSSKELPVEWRELLEGVPV